VGVVLVEAVVTGVLADGGLEFSPERTSTTATVTAARKATGAP
jgi:hypothetical protein